MSRNPGFDSSSRQPKGRRSSALRLEHAELLRSTPSLVLCCAWLVTMALHMCTDDLISDELEHISQWAMMNNLVLNKSKTN